VVIFLADYLLPDWKGLLYQFSDDAKKDKSATWFTLLAILEVALATAFVATFVYGAYAVLSIFGRQRNATPGTEVCDRRLYDPLFFIIILFDLVLVIALLLAICLNCDALCCCWPDEAADYKKDDDLDSGRGRRHTASHQRAAEASPLVPKGASEPTKADLLAPLASAGAGTPAAYSVPPAGPPPSQTVAGGSIAAAAASGRVADALAGGVSDRDVESGGLAAPPHPAAAPAAH